MENPFPLFSSFKITHTSEGNSKRILEVLSVEPSLITINELAGTNERISARTLAKVLSLLYVGTMTHPFISDIFKIHVFLGAKIMLFPTETFAYKNT